MLFWWFSVGLQKYQPLLRLRCSSANRLFTPAGSHVSSSRAHGLSPDLWSVLSPSAHSPVFLTPSLIYRNGAGHRHFIPRKIMSSVTSGSAVRSRQQYHPWAVMPAFVSPPGLPIRFSFIQIALPRTAAAISERQRQAGLW